MQTVKQQTKALWLCSFGDDKEFADFYFETYFSDKNNVIVEQNGKIISALQTLPFMLEIENKTVQSAYLSSICTDKNFQNQGFMRCLMNKTHRALFDSGYMAATLVPANENLEKTYQKFGYATLETALLFNQLQKIYGELIESEFPRGMLRIIDVEKFLRIFAEMNPEKEFEFNVFDETITENCGNYCFKNTFFVKSNEYNKNLSTLSIKDLAEFVFNNFL